MEQIIVTKGDADRAGKILRDAAAPPDKVDGARRTLFIWRSMHAFPLFNITAWLRKCTASDGRWASALVSRRMKRMPSIIDKLQRFPHMRASRMQDIGGVRVIVDTVQDVYDLHKAVSGSKKSRHILETPPDDYIARPKQDGYRSLHQVFRCMSVKHPETNGLRIELQIRTRLQHAWATAVETLGAVERASFKTGEGDATVKRFFQVASALFSLDERQPVVEACAGMTPQALVEELDRLDARLGATTKLKALSVRELFHRRRQDKRGILLLVLHVSPNEESQLDIQQYDNMPMAEMSYQGIELLYKDTPAVSVLLMTTDNIAKLQQAYPNYYLDASLFLENIQRICDKHRHPR